ncbi:hypothetical protein EJ110_NYTH46877 [Nymphaea thermarum]|nr:hypothetical protein EJ110_NYTH46877 [Nymphaea thermarum]
MRCQPWLHVIGKEIKNIPFAIPLLVFRLLGKQISKPGNIRSAMRFHEAGVEFKKAEPYSGLEITFDEEHGVLTLPFIQIDENTTTIYMNLMAFERIDEDAASVFNKLGEGITYSLDDELYKKLQLECGESIFEAKLLPKPMVYYVSTCCHCLTGVNIYSDPIFCVSREK